jgi:predicted exporter
VRAVALCAATSIAVFALLATASVPILSQIGWTVAVGSLLSFALGLVFAAPTAERAA